MEECIRIVNENGITKVYYKPEDITKEILFHKLKNGESARICVVGGKLSSINEKYIK